MAELGPVIAIGMPLSIVVLGMGRVPGRRLGLPPELHWEQPRRPPIITDKANAAITPIRLAIEAAMSSPFLDGPTASGTMPIGDDPFPKASSSRNPD